MDENENEQIETVDVDGKRFIILESSRRWPKYVVTWSVRQKEGESDFPVATGEVEQLPPSKSEDLGSVLSGLRAAALGEAMAAADTQAAKESEGKQGSFLGRLFGRS